jgi:hypothetical protein
VACFAGNRNHPGITTTRGDKTMIGILAETFMTATRSEDRSRVQAYPAKVLFAQDGRPRFEHGREVTPTR